MENFQEHLRCIRKSQKATQKEAAIASGVTERNYQDWEYGNTKPSFDALVALANYFNVPLDYLMGRGLFANWNTVLKYWEPILNEVRRISFVDSNLIQNFIHQYTELTHEDKLKMGEFLSILISAIDIDESTYPAKITLHWKI